ncbi:MAG: MBOAT family protein [Alphaproteobacteria bacterium]|nr:MBOAT family protein [Alphaproteobacteria bacterium]
MLFNSFTFIFGFLPLTLAGFFIVRRIFGQNASFGWLVAASIFFYGWWNPQLVLLLLGSLCGNFLIGRAIASTAEQHLRGLFVFGIVANLGLLAYFKYTDFFIGTMNDLTGVNWTLQHIILPLGISFFTFQQIAWLADIRRGTAHKPSFLHFTLFVTFFPQLIAGPIVHHAEMMPQFTNRYDRSSANDLSIGVTIFGIGLFKKAVIADSMALYSTPVFEAAVAGQVLTVVDAWGGALAYTFQIYFDFSGYSDMAIGLARMFGIILPLNFHSPYKARSIIEFWRRWHLTLSRFLRDYLYVPLGGNRHGNYRRYTNLLIVMILGGLWHGAAWTFIIWGFLHGMLLTINHLWRAISSAVRPQSIIIRNLGASASLILTFLAVVITWVFFRSANLDTATNILGAMAGMNGFVLPAVYQPLIGGLVSSLPITYSVMPLFGGGTQVVITALLMVFVWTLPNTQELMKYVEPIVTSPSRVARTRLRISPSWGLLLGVVAALGLCGTFSVSEFIYFQF